MYIYNLHIYTYDICNRFLYIKPLHRQTAVPLMALGGLQEVSHPLGRGRCCGRFGGFSPRKVEDWSNVG